MLLAAPLKGLTSSHPTVHIRMACWQKAPPALPVSMPDHIAVAHIHEMRLWCERLIPGEGLGAFTAGGWIAPHTGCVLKSSIVDKTSKEWNSGRTLHVHQVERLQKELKDWQANVFLAVCGVVLWSRQQQRLRVLRQESEQCRATLELKLEAAPAAPVVTCHAILVDSCVQKPECRDFWHKQTWSRCLESFYKKRLCPVRSANTCEDLI